MDSRAGRERLCRLAKGKKIATVANVTEIPGRTLREHLLLETRS